MAYEEKRSLAAPHKLILEDRARLSISGVDSIGSFDETLVEASTSRGPMNIRGDGLNIEKLSLETGEVTITGTIDSLEYENGSEQKGGILSRLFK